MQNFFKKIFVSIANVWKHICRQVLAKTSDFRCILNISDVFTAFYHYNWLYLTIPNYNGKMPYFRNIQNTARKLFLDFFSIAYVWKHICRQVLAKTKKFYPHHVGGGGVPKTPENGFFSNFRAILRENGTLKKNFDFRSGFSTIKLGQKS